MKKPTMTDEEASAWLARNGTEPQPIQDILNSLWAPTPKGTNKKGKKK